MTKEQFLRTLCDVREHVMETAKACKQLADEGSDMLPTATGQKKWAVEAEVPMNIAVFNLSSISRQLAGFADDMEDLITNFE